MRAILLAAVATVAVWTIAGPAQAQVYDYCSFHPEECAAAASSQTETQRATTQKTMSLISARVAQFASGGRGGLAQTAALSGGTTSGVSTGDMANSPIGAWGAVSRAWLDNDSTTTPFSTDAWTGLAGADIQIDGLLIGATLSYEDSESRLDLTDGKHNTNGWMITPYAAKAYLNGALVIDAMVGFGQLSTDVRRNISTAAPISGGFDSNRYMAATNVTYQTLADTTLLSIKGGYLYAYEDGEGYTDSSNTTVGDQNSRLGTLRLEGLASWMIGSVEPYVAAALLYDVHHSKVTNGSNDRTAVEARAGATFYASDSLSGGLEYSEEFSRRDMDSRALTLNVRTTF